MAEERDDASRRAREEMLRQTGNAEREKLRSTPPNPEMEKLQRMSAEAHFNREREKPMEVKPGNWITPPPRDTRPIPVKALERLASVPIPELAERLGVTIDDMLEYCREPMLIPRSLYHRLADVCAAEAAVTPRTDSLRKINLEFYAEELRKAAVTAEE
jgi:hypothetical protein